VQLGSGELLAALLPEARSPVSGLGQILIDFLPGPGVDMAVATVRAKDKALLRSALVASVLGSGYLATRLEARGRGRGRWLLIGQGLIGGAAAASRPENSSASSLLAGMGAGAAGAGTFAVMTGKESQLRERVLFAAGSTDNEHGHGPPLAEDNVGGLAATEMVSGRVLPHFQTPG